jgi:hypothetical protein
MRKNSKMEERTILMRIRRMLVVGLCGFLCAAYLAAPVYAQDKPAPVPVGYRIQVVVSEYDGTNKVSSMPYAIPVAEIPGESRTSGSMRVGIRVPVNATTKSGESAVQYMDIGTNLDVRVKRADADRYAVELTLERAWLYVRESKDGKAEGRPWAPGDPAPSGAPLNHQFRANVTFLLRDGKASETTVATDPDTGHVVKVDVLLTVLK